MGGSVRTGRGGLVGNKRKRRLYRADPAPAADSSPGVLLISNRAALLTVLVKARQLLVIYGSTQGIQELQGSSSQRRQPGRLTTLNTRRLLFQGTRMQPTTRTQRMLACGRSGAVV